MTTILRFDERELWQEEGISIALMGINHAAKNLRYTGRVLQELSSSQELLDAKHPEIIDAAVGVVGLNWRVTETHSELYMRRMALDEGLTETRNSIELPDVSLKEEIANLLFEKASYLYALKRAVCRLYPTVRIEEVYGVECKIVKVYNRYFHIPRSTWPKRKPRRKARLVNPILVYPSYLEKAIERCEAEVLGARKAEEKAGSLDDDSNSDEPMELQRKDSDASDTLTIEEKPIEQLLEDFKNDFPVDLEDEGDEVEMWCSDFDEDEDSWLGDV